MNCYNGEKYLKEAIDSVLAQTYTNFEIILWDNRSEDKSAEIINSYRDERIKYFLGKEHVPLGAARNLALNKAKGDFISFLDADDLWKSDKLVKQIHYFNNPTVGLVYCRTKKINSHGKTIGQYKYNATNKKYTSVFFKDLFINYDIVLSSAIISKKALLSTVKKFDNLLIFAEEFDLFMGICSKYSAVRVEEILTSYRIHEKQDTLRLFERSIFEEEYIIAKLRLLYPNLFATDTKLLITRNKVIAWHYFLNYILKNNAVEARKKLFPFVFSSLKYFSFYLLSFLGSRVVKTIWNYYRKKSGKFSFKT